MNCWLVTNRATVKTLEDAICVNKQQYKERTHYSLQLKEQLDTVREEAAIQVTKIKDFSECQRLKFVHEIQKLENQLAETRAMACNEFKRRDNVSIHRLKPIFNLNGILFFPRVLIFYVYKTNISNSCKQMPNFEFITIFDLWTQVKHRIYTGGINTVCYYARTVFP